ncbi:SDR family NAD(P)-dependent oxidoreductase [Sphingomonas sp. UYP23]
MLQLANRNALVTGASGGIGSETARRLAAAGARVAVHAHRNFAGAQAVVADIIAAGGEAFALAGDAADADAITRIADGVAARFGSIDILVHVAGTSPQLPFGAVTPQTFDALFRDNVLSAILAMQESARHMGAGGRMVTVSSNLCYGPMPGLVPYAAAKAALITLTQGFARELGPRRIAVNAVAPGAIETPMTDWIPLEIRAAIAASTPLGRMGQPDDVADAIVFLASPAAKWVNGRTLIVDGGLV